MYTPTKLPKLDLTADAEFVANLLGCKRATVQFVTWVYMLYLHNRL